MSTAVPPDDSVAWKVWVTSIVSVVAATLAIIGRLIARKISGAHLWWDDYTIIVSGVVQWGQAVCRWVLVLAFYYGHHAIYVGPKRLTGYRQEFVAIQTLYFLNTTLTKISILLLYYRIFGVVNNFRIALYIAAALVIAYWIPTTILAYLGCTPFARNWDQTLPGTCVNLVAFFRWNGICNLILDVLILCLPIPMVWRLSVSVRQRLELSGIFLLGAFVCVTSVMRIVSYDPKHLKDNTYAGVGSMTWSQVEQGIGILCACLPTFRPLVMRLFPNRSTKGGAHDQSRNSAIGMGALKPELRAPGKSAWAPQAFDSDSTVGFARLNDEEGGVMSPADVQRSVYAPVAVGSKLTTTAEREGHRDRTVGGNPQEGILKEQTIDQSSETVK